MTRAPTSDKSGAPLAVTLLPATDPTDQDSYCWDGPPPENAIARLFGRPHLTWIFIVPHAAGHGVGTALIRAVASALRELGYTELASTFLVGNDSSMLWHWRVGFRLLSYSSSWRTSRGVNPVAFPHDPT